MVQASDTSLTLAKAAKGTECSVADLAIKRHNKDGRTPHDFIERYDGAIPEA